MTKHRKTEANDPMISELVRGILVKHLLPAGDFIFGFADLTGLLDPQFNGCNYGISIGKKLDNRIIDSIHGGPTPEYYEHYNQTNSDLSRLARVISEDLKANGIQALSVEPSISTELLDTKYTSTLRTPLSHKMVATRAGLGWIGKTDLLVTKKFGTRLRLVSLLTSTPLESRIKPVDRGRCGTCTDCVKACPAGAATGKTWDTSVDRDQFFDAAKCRAMCKMFGEKVLGDEARVCGICVSVCPIGKNNRN